MSKSTKPTSEPRKSAPNFESKTFLKGEKKKKAARNSGEVTEAAWGTQIRSYVLHPYKMVKDLRTDFESSNPDVTLDGELDGFLRAYLEWDARHS